jgi:hypothetical protein
MAVGSPTKLQHQITVRILLFVILVLCWLDVHWGLMETLGSWGWGNLGSSLSSGRQIRTDDLHVHLILSKERQPEHTKGVTLIHQLVTVLYLFGVSSQIQH